MAIDVPAGAERALLLHQRRLQAQPRHGVCWALTMRRLIVWTLGASIGGMTALSVAAPAESGTAQTAVQTALQTVLARGDHGGRPFVVIDKQRARLHLYAADGTALGDTPVLLGLARGDDSVPGVGDKPLDQIPPHERTTPAGRFVSEPGVNTQGEDVIWVDYDAAISMHRVRANVAAERRLQRLASATPDDNRISWGCINVPAVFYDQKLLPAFNRQRAVVYVLPETRALRTLFDAAPGGR